MKKTICSIVLAVALNPISASAGEFLDSSKQYIKNGIIQGTITNRDVVLNNKINMCRENYMLPNGIELRLGYPIIAGENNGFLQFIYPKFPAYYNFVKGEENEMYEDMAIDGLNGNEKFREDHSEKNKINHTDI